VALRATRRGKARAAILPLGLLMASPLSGKAGLPAAIPAWGQGLQAEVIRLSAAALAAWKQGLRVAAVRLPAEAFVAVPVAVPVPEQ